MVIQLACVYFVANYAVSWDYIFGRKPRSLKPKTVRVCNCFSVLSLKLKFILIVSVSFLIDTNKQKHQLGIQTLVEEDLAQSLDKNIDKLKIFSFPIAAASGFSFKYIYTNSGQIFYTFRKPILFWRIQRKQSNHILQYTAYSDFVGADV